MCINWDKQYKLPEQPGNEASGKYKLVDAVSLLKCPGCEGIIIALLNEHASNGEYMDILIMMTQKGNCYYSNV